MKKERAPLGAHWPRPTNKKKIRHKSELQSSVLS